MDELNIVSTSTYEFLNNAYTKLLDKHAYLVEENDIQRSSIQQLSRQVVELQAELYETYTDNNGIIWCRPTAEAYYRVCRARDNWQKESERIGKLLDVI